MHDQMLCITSPHPLRQTPGASLPPAAEDCYPHPCAPVAGAAGHAGGRIPGGCMVVHPGTRATIHVCSSPRLS